MLKAETKNMDKIFLARDIFEEKDEEGEIQNQFDSDSEEYTQDFLHSLPLELIIEGLSSSGSEHSAKDPLAEDQSPILTPELEQDTPDADTTTPPKKKQRLSDSINSNDTPACSASNVSKLSRAFRKKGYSESPQTQSQPVANKVPKSEKRVHHDLYGHNDSSSDDAPVYDSNVSKLMRRFKIETKKDPSTSQSHTGTQMSQSQSVAKKIPKSVDEMFYIAHLDTFKGAKIQSSVEKGYEARNGLLVYKKVIDWCIKNTGVKEIRLINVVSAEYYYLVAGRSRDLFDKVNLPDLRDFKMQIKCMPESSHARVMDSIRRFGLEEHLFFILARGINAQFIEELLGRNICISIEGLKLLQVSAQDQSITASLVNGNEIVSNLPASVKKISLRDVEFPADLSNCRCENITEIVLSNCAFPSGASLFDFLVQCVKLQDFTLDGYGLKVFNLQRMLPYFLKLKKLVLSQVSLSIPLESPPQLSYQYHRLLRLAIVNSIWDESFEKKIPLMFPNLLEVHMGNDDTMSPISWNLVKSVMKCHFIQRIHVWGCRNFPEHEDSSKEVEFSQIIKDLKKVGKGVVPEYFELISGDKVKWRKWTVKTGKASIAEDQQFELLRETFFINRRGYNRYENGN